MWNIVPRELCKKREDGVAVAIVVKSLFFEGLRDKVLIEQPQVKNIYNVDSLMLYVDSKYRIIEQGFNFERFIVFVNGVKAKQNTPVADGDEIMIFIPISGG